MVAARRDFEPRPCPLVQPVTDVEEEHAQTSGQRLAVESVVAPADTFVNEPVETGKPLLPGGAEGVHRMLEQFVQIEPHFLHAVEALLRKAAREDHSPPLEIVADARPGHELLVDAHDEVAGLHGDGPAVDDHVGLAPFAQVEHHEVDAVHPVGALDVVEVGEGEYLGARVLRARGQLAPHVTDAELLYLVVFH